MFEGNKRMTCVLPVLPREVRRPELTSVISKAVSSPHLGINYLLRWLHGPRQFAYRSFEALDVTEPLLAAKRSGAPIGP